MKKVSQSKLHEQLLQATNPSEQRDLALDLLSITLSRQYIINYIIENAITEFFDWLEQIIKEAKDDDLHKYGLIMMATSRNEAIINLLYSMSQDSPRHRISNFVEAIELVPASDKRNNALATLRQLFD